MNRGGNSFFHKIKAYKLKNNFWVILVLIICVTISIAVYLAPIKNEVAPALALAVATSLLASIFCLISETYVRYKTYENDTFLESIEQLGIADLHFDKQQLLTDLITDCRNELWISGYRLILTRNIAKLLTSAASRNIKIRILVTPPWEDAFQLVYGTSQRVIDNYIVVFDAIIRGNTSMKEQCEIRFTNKPLFNDTYNIDGHIITGPYMHNEDPLECRITAKDFFTYELHKKSRLYNMIEGEYCTIWKEAEYRLDWDKYNEVRQKFDNIQLTEVDRMELFKQTLEPVQSETERKLHIV